MIETPAAHAHSLVLLPDGDTCVVSAENDGELYVVSLRAGRVTATLREHTMPVNCLALADDGRLLLSASDDGTVRVWDTATWRVRWVLEGHEGFVREVAGGGMVAVSGGEDHTVRVWDLRRGVRRRVFREHGHSVDRVAVSGDGRWAATASRDNHLVVWDLTTLAVRRELYRANQMICDVPGFGSVYMALGGNDTGVGHKEAPHTLRFDRSGRLFSTSQEVICWDLDTGAESFRFPWCGWRIVALAEHRSEPILAAVGWNTVRICDSDGVSLASRQTAEAGSKSLVDAAFAPDGRLVTVDKDGVLRIWPPYTSADRGDDRHQAMVSEIAIDPTGRFAATHSLNDDVMVWDLRTGARTAEIQGTDSTFDVPVFTPDGERMMVVLDPARLQVLPTAGGPGHTLPTHADEAPEADEAADSDDTAEGSPHLTGVVAVDAESALVTQYTKALEVWRLADGARRTFNGAAGSGQASGCAITSDRRYALLPTQIETGHPAFPKLSADDTSFGIPAMQCWDLVRGELLWTRCDDVPKAYSWPSHAWASLLDDTTAVFPVGYDDDARDDDARELLVVDILDNSVRRRVPVSFDCDRLTRLTDGSLMFVTRDGDATELWILRSGADVLERHLTLPASWSTRVIPGRELVLQVSDSTLRAYELGTGVERGGVDLPEAGARLEVSADGATVVVGGRQGGVHIFRLPPLDVE